MRTMILALMLAAMIPIRISGEVVVGDPIFGCVTFRNVPSGDYQICTTISYHLGE